MEKFKFTPESGFMDGTHYPNPNNENEVREQFQRPLNQIRDYINKMLGIILTDEEIIALINNNIPKSLKNPFKLIVKELGEIVSEYDGSEERVVEISSRALTPTYFDEETGDLEIGSDAGLAELFNMMNANHVIDALGYTPISQEELGDVWEGEY